MGNKAPKILNLDELENLEPEISIVHKGQKHFMRVLTVDEYLAQAKRAERHDKLQAKAEEDQTEETMEQAISIIKESIENFFPTLPVGELETSKLFSIFAWMNELSSQINEAGADEVEGDASGESGNGEDAA